MRLVDVVGERRHVGGRTGARRRRRCQEVTMHDRRMATPMALGPAFLLLAWALVRSVV